MLIMLQFDLFKLLLVADLDLIEDERVHNLAIAADDAVPEDETVANFGIVANFYRQGLQIVGTFVDTFRQLFRGRVNPDLFTDIEFSLSLNEKTFQLKGVDWLLGKSGKNSGYQYRLQNNELGLVILFKQYHAKADTPASHLKIECSPWFLDARTPEVQLKCSGCFSCSQTGIMDKRLDPIDSRGSVRLCTAINMHHLCIEQVMPNPEPHSAHLQ